MAENRIQMPSGGGGIVRYFDDYKSKVTLKPGYVVMLVLLVVVLLLVLQLYGKMLLGF